MGEEAEIGMMRCQTVYDGQKTDIAVSGGRELMLECYRKYGWEREMLMMAEECSELIQASTKLQRAVACGGDCDDALYHLAEEMADVRIMLAQLSIMFGLDGDIAEWVKYKLERTRRRMAAHGRKLDNGIESDDMAMCCR